MKKKLTDPRDTAALKAADKGIASGHLLFRTLLITSSFLFWVLIGFFWMLTGINITYLVCCVFFGALSSLFISRVRIRKFRPLILIAGAVAAGIICYLAIDQLSAKFSGSSPSITYLSELIGSITSADPAAVLKHIGSLLAVFSFPFILYIVCLIINYLAEFFRLDSIKHFAAELRIISIRSVVVTHLILIANIFAAIIAGILLLCAVYSIPVEPIDKNVARSAPVLEEEGRYPHIVSWCSSQSDNHADSIMLMEAADNTDAPLLTRALLSNRGYLSDDWTYVALVQHYCHDVPLDGSKSYARYWHGYLIFLKPLLFFFDVKELRLINGICQLLLAVVLCATMSRKKMRILVIPFIISYLMLKPVLLAHCFEFSLCYYIIVIGSIALLCLKDVTKGRRALLLFLYIGIAVGYFDFLTYPAATFGLPAVIYTYMLPDRSLSEKIIRLFKAGYSWLLGYAVMWFSKWVVGTAVTGNDIIGSGLNTLSYRISSQNEAANPLVSVLGRFRDILGCLIKNGTYFLQNPFIVLFVAFIIFMIIKIKRNGGLSAQEIPRMTAPYVFLAVIPFLWYSFALNHSQIHYWFTNKALIMSVMAVTTGAVDLLRYCKADRTSS